MSKNIVNEADEILPVGFNLNGSNPGVCVIDSDVEAVEGKPKQKLSPEQEKALQECENVIERNKDAFLEVHERAKGLADGAAPTIEKIEQAKEETCPENKPKSSTQKSSDPLDSGDEVITLAMKDGEDLPTLLDMLGFIGFLLRDGATTEEIEEELVDAVALVLSFMHQVYDFDEEEAA